MKEELQNLYALIKWMNSKEAEAVLNSPPHPHTMLDTLWFILLLLMFFAQVFGICFAFKILVYNKIARAIKAKRQSLRIQRIS